MTNILFIMYMQALQESTDSIDRVACSATPLVTEKLWVEKYAPNSFTELLSDEHTNREVKLFQIPPCYFKVKVSVFCLTFSLDICVCALLRYFYGLNNGTPVFLGPIFGQRVMMSYLPYVDTLQPSTRMQVTEISFPRVRGVLLQVKMTHPWMHKAAIQKVWVAPSAKSHQLIIHQNKRWASTAVLYVQVCDQNLSLNICWFVTLVHYCNWIPSWCCRCCYYVVHLGLERPHLLMLQPDIVATMLWRSVLWSYNASSALVI